VSLSKEVHPRIKPKDEYYSFSDAMCLFVG
jgi:hypothetical protein